MRAAVRRVAEHATAIGRLEAELAQLELKRKAASFGLGAALALGAVLSGLFMVTFLFATLTAVLAIFVDTWLALLIMTFVFAMLTGVLGLFARRLFRRATPPLPEQAIHEAKLTRDAVRP